MAQPKNHIIYAPSEETPRGVKSVFLAGTTSKVDPGDWRETLSTSLSDLPVTIYSPYRPDWDSSWREDIDFAPYREQVEWELDKLDKSDTVVIYFHPATQAPISLLELGLCARVPGKALVVCPEGYWKRGNVQIVCEKYGVEMVDNVDALRDAIVERLSFGVMADIAHPVPNKSDQRWFGFHSGSMFQPSITRSQCYSA
ncbi:hypothetical protein Y699_04136 [Aspergillus fumigatus Z5]|nr:hypothetical protein Y699_04136 [Aspergillus fumigatus Z5]